MEGNYYIYHALIGDFERDHFDYSILLHEERNGTFSRVLQNNVQVTRTSDSYWYDIEYCFGVIPYFFLKAAIK